MQRKLADSSGNVNFHQKEATMNILHQQQRLVLLLAWAMAGLLVPCPLQAVPVSLRPDIGVAKVLDTAAGAPPVRLVRATVSGQNRLYYLKLNGDIYEVNPVAKTQSKIYSVTQHRLASTQGLAIGPTGTFYVVGNEDRPNQQTRATIVKGVLDPLTNQRVWTVLAQSAPYAKSGDYDHLFNAIIVGPSGRFIYVNSGSRTDHGEVQSMGGLYPNLREAGLTACILILPADGSNIQLPNNRGILKTKGYIFAEGVRNNFDFAFTVNGDLMGTENGPGRDMPDELNWLRPGGHYGFPWRFGNLDNPQQFPNYDPARDKLLNPRLMPVIRGYYHNDPTFPPKPARVMFDAISNAGPDADSFRDPVDGLVKDSSALGLRISTFTPHRSPLGLVFNKSNNVSAEFKFDGFMLSWTKGEATGNLGLGPFMDASQDLLDLDMTKGVSNYSIKAKRIVGGFNNPIDAEMIGNAIYVLEFGGSKSIWKITLPSQ
jgi:Glucose / Sorbosone dehydrogenase